MDPCDSGFVDPGRLCFAATVVISHNLDGAISYGLDIRSVTEYESAKNISKHDPADYFTLSIFAQQSRLFAEGTRKSE